MAAFRASVCVFCGARTGRDPDLMVRARETGAMLARNRWRLVFGAGDVGLMGEVARAARAEGGRSLGVIPLHLKGREAARSDPADLVVTETMHERKKVMFANSDAIVVLPGGAGTLDEFFEVLTWAQIGLHRKPILLLDAGGYWQPLVTLVEHVIARGFAEPTLHDTGLVEGGWIDSTGRLPSQDRPCRTKPFPPSPGCYEAMSASARDALRRCACSLWA